MKPLTVFATGIVLMLGWCLSGCGAGPVAQVEEIDAPDDQPAAEEGDDSAVQVAAAGSDWPWWRGPSGDGKAPQAENLPLQWGDEENIVWRADVPGRGHSSPAIWDDRIFLTTADEQKETQSLLCFDLQSGDQKWQQMIHSGSFVDKHRKNSHASATPACDGERVYCVFANDNAVRVTVTDLKGEVVWQTEAGPYTSEHGYGSSPILYKSLVIVAGDSLQESFIAALDRKTGDIVWRTARTGPGRHGNYSTPAVAEVAGKPQLVLPGHGKVTSYDPLTGDLIWWCDGPSEVAANTVAFGEEIVYTSGGYPEKELLAIRADGRGEVTDSHVEWSTDRGVTYVPSPVLYEGHLYVINDGGVATCFDAANGERVWQQRLPGNFSASPLVADGRLYITNENGITFVLRAAPEFEQLAENSLGSRGFASPAVSGNRLFLRTGDALYCIANNAP